MLLHASSRALQYSPSALAGDQQEAESEQSYQHPLTLSIADDDSDDEQLEYDYINNDQQPMIELTQCPAYWSTSQH